MPKRKLVINATEHRHNLLSRLADITAIDGTINSRERTAFLDISRQLKVSDIDAEEILGNAWKLINHQDDPILEPFISKET